MAYGASKYDTSAFMAGDIFVDIVFIESNGQIDRSTEDWTTEEISKVITFIDNACNWWETMWDNRGYKGDLNFTLNASYVYSAYEPISRTVDQGDSLWISEYLNSEGYSGSKNTMMYSYNNDLISANNSDFAFTIFVVKADNDSDHLFADNYHAYTWGAYSGYNHSYVTMAYSEYYDWYTEAPFAHEIAHIFGAADEYEGQGRYTDIKGYYGTQNTNAVDGHPNPQNIVTSLMNTSIQKAYREYTSSPQSLEMIGWRDTDGDGVIDVLDAPINITDYSASLQLNNSVYSFSGVFTVGKNQNYNGKKAITINDVDRLVYRYGESGAWIPVNNYDWNVESKNISHSFVLPENDVLQWKVIDSSGTTESEIYTVGNVRNCNRWIDNEYRSAYFSFTPATRNTGIEKYNISIDNDIYAINGNTLSCSNLSYGEHQWKVQGVYSDQTVTDWLSCGTFTISPKVITASISGGKNGASWKSVDGIEEYEIQYSKDNYQTVMSFTVSDNEVSLYNIENGQYQWRIGCQDSPEWSSGTSFTASGNFEIQEYSAAEDGVTDIFIGCAKGEWRSGYTAQHLGVLNGWGGTGELAELSGRNKLSDIFEGSSDANVLVMTDDKNGDALFVDDIYTVLGNQARLSQIDEIRAGFGDDIVDMTSQQFSYVGDGVKIYGGSGNDTIWANNGENRLFGDAGKDRIVGGSGNDMIIGGSGNDSMHGGGGNDIFTFGENCGIDTIEQLGEGTVTLWFETGTESNWNSSTLTYTDGMNSVSVKGITSGQITLKFGDDGSLLYDELSENGCFEPTASATILEYNNGMLA